MGKERTQQNLLRDRTNAWGGHTIFKNQPSKKMNYGFFSVFFRREDRLQAPPPRRD
jgi:hypothetical protein